MRLKAKDFIDRFCCSPSETLSDYVNAWRRRLRRPPLTINEIHEILSDDKLETSDYDVFAEHDRVIAFLISYDTRESIAQNIGRFLDIGVVLEDYFHGGD